MHFFGLISYFTSSGQAIYFSLSSSKSLTVELNGARIIDFVDAFFNRLLPLVLVSKLCSVKITSVSCY